MPGPAGSNLPPVDPSLAAIISDAKAEAFAEDPNNLSLKVTSAEERRCPFLTTYSEKEDEEVDGLCDIRIQKFSDIPPFGPTDLRICEICIRGKTYEISAGQAEMMSAAAEEARKQVDAGKTSAPREAYR